LVYNNRLSILGAGIWVRKLDPLLWVCNLKMLLNRDRKSGWIHIRCGCILLPFLVAFMYI